MARLNLFKEFKEFALRGNVIDLAVGIIIGAAFSQVVNSLVKDVLMPPIGLLVGGVDFSQLSIPLRSAKTDAAGNVTAPAVSISYGVFFNAIISFLIVALAVFLLVKAINTLRRKLETKPATAADAPPPALTTEQRLLTEIRDLLKPRS